MHYNEGKTKGMKYDKSMDNRLCCAVFLFILAFI